MNDFTGVDIANAPSPNFFKYQQDFLATKAGQNIFVLKSRQIGVIWRYIQQFCRENFKVSVQGKSICQLKMPDGMRTVYLVFCSTNSSTTQSYNGDVIFDEFAWVLNCDEILNTALAMATQKDYRILFITTASHTSHPAYRIWKGLDEQGNQVPDNLHRIKINIHQAIKPGCNLLKSTDDLKKLVGERRFKFVYKLEWLDDAYQGLTENLKASKSNQAGSIIFYNVNQATRLQWRRN